MIFGFINIIVNMNSNRLYSVSSIIVKYIGGVHQEEEQHGPQEGAKLHDYAGQEEGGVSVLLRVELRHNVDLGVGDHRTDGNVHHHLQKMNDCYLV